MPLATVFLIAVQLMFIASPETALAHNAQTSCPEFDMGDANAPDQWEVIEAERIVKAVKSAS